MSASILELSKRAVKMGFIENIVLISTFFPMLAHATITQYHSGLYATKTTYDNSYKGDRNILDHGFTGYDISEIRDKYFKEVTQIPGCKAIHINGLFRHGTRYPGAKDTKRVTSALEQMREKLVDKNIMSKLDGIAVLLASKGDEKSLANNGVVELEGIGTRLGERFTDLFQGSLEEDFLFETSSKSRALDSGKAFRLALKNTMIDKKSNMPKFKIRDDLLRSFDNCSDYIRFVEGDPSYMFEYKEFRRTVFPDISKKLAAKLERDLAFTDAEIKSMYVYAASEFALIGSSYWGELFDLEDIIALEYAADVKSYWKRGYGHRLSYEHICPLLKDIFSHLNDAVIGFKYKKGVFRFAHAETLLPLMTMLGLFNDTEPLMAADFPGHEDRLFRTSSISPFAGNLAIVLYYCDPDHDLSNSQYSSHLKLPPSYDRYMIQLLHKEIPIPFPFTKYDLARFEDVKRFYKKYTKHCDFNEICGNPPRNNMDHEFSHDEL